ncbi:MAG: WecB/TagA/CpsF family glycosyltransferase [Candidatus Woesebacteria bacterium]|jgi:N-acetylglucosaminyldiphosphoundecaprenol N-acetyl-beta-D-mannosaminyltransferase
MKKIDSQALLFGMKFFSSSKEDLLKLLKKGLKQAKTQYIFTPNPEQLVQSSKDKSFLKALQEANILIPDGVGLVWASIILASLGKAKKIKERITGIDLAMDLLEVAQEKKLKVLLVGGRGYDKKELQAKFGDNIFWTEAYQNVKQVKEQEEQALQKSIKKLRPAIVLVAFGAAEQEKWVVKHKRLLESSGAKIVMVVGGAFDVILGKIPRAPKLMRFLGLEWLYRLIKEPWRWKRQLRLLDFLELLTKEIKKKK